MLNRLYLLILIAIDGSVKIEEKLKMKYLKLTLIAFLAFHFSNAQTVNMEEKSFTSKSGTVVKGDVGKLMVSENRDNPYAEEIAIHFIRLKSTNPNPQAPIMYLEGGPGSSCTWQAENEHYLENWLSYLALGDVILVDQRGTGAGTERVLYLWKKDPPADILANYETLENHAKKVKQAALEAFNQRGVDLKGYTTLESAKDLDQLRKALSYEKISLLGFSYGTHLGQAYMKYFGDYVDQAVLAGVEGLNHTFKLPSAMDIHFRKLALMSNADNRVNKEVPDLLALYKKVIENLKKNPVEIEVISLLSGQPIPMKIGEFGLNLILFLDLGDASDLPVIPRLLYQIDQGDYSSLRWFIQKRMSFLYGTQGMATTMDPASGVTASRLSRIATEQKSTLFGKLYGFLQGSDPAWPNPDLGEDFRAPLTSNIRTLFLSGTLDFNTPPYQAEEVKWGFSNSSHLIVNNAGHEQILNHPKATETIIRFLKRENVADVALSYPQLKFIPIKGNQKDLWHPSLD